jgi:hypothetical protein
MFVETANPQALTLGVFFLSKPAVPFKFLKVQPLRHEGTKKLNLEYLWMSLHSVIFMIFFFKIDPSASGS